MVRDSKKSIFSLFFLLFSSVLTSTAIAQKALVLGGAYKTEDREVNFIQRQIQLTGLYEAVDVLKVGRDAASVPAATQLNPYPLIVVVTDDSGLFLDRNAVGDALDDYMKADPQHAVLVFSPFVWHSFPYGIGGRFLTNYALTPQATEITGGASLDTGSVVAHPLTKGLGAFSCGAPCARLELRTTNPGAQVVATWSDGYLLAVYGDRRVDLNMRPYDNTVASDGFDPAGTVLIQNAIRFLTPSPLTPMPDSVHFADTGLGGRNQEILSLTNTTASKISIVSFSFAGTDASPFAVAIQDGRALPSPGTPLTLDPGKSVNLIISFSPSLVRPYSVFLVAQTVSSGSIAVSVIGAGIDTTLSATPGMLDFGARSSIVTPPTLKVSVKNLMSTGANRTISNLTLLDSTAFSLVSPPALPLLLFPGADIDLEIAFDPKGKKGLFLSTLAIESDDTDSPLLVPLQGRYGDPKLTLSSASYMLSPQTVGTSGAPFPIPFQNTGDADLIITSLASDNSQFVVINPPTPMAPLTIAPGMNSSFQVYFAPTTPGNQTAQVTIQSNVPDQKVSLKAEGAYAQFSIDKTTLNFGDVNLGQQVIQTLTLRNTSKVPLTLHTLKFTPVMGMPTSFFFIQAPAILPTIIPGGGTLPIQVSCSPQDPMALGALAANLIIVTNAHTDGTKQVSITGNGMGGFLQPSESQIRFENVPVGNTTNKILQLTNTGQDPVTIQRAEIVDSTQDPTHTLRVNLPSVGTMVQPGKSIDVPIRFSTSMVGMFSVRVEIGTTYQTLSLLIQATSVSPHIAMDPTVLDFPPTLIGSQSGILSTTVTNTGNVPIMNLDVSPVGAKDNAFSLLPGYKTFLQPGEKTEIQFIFWPSVARGYIATQRFLTANGVEIPMGMIALRGTAVQVALEIHPAEVHFSVYKEPTAKGQRVTQTFTITNTGPINVQFVPRWANASQGPFSVSWPSAFGDSLITLLPGETVSLTVAFQTDKNGTYQDELQLFNNANIFFESIPVKAVQTRMPLSAKSDTGCSTTPGHSGSVGWIVAVLLALGAYRLQALRFGNRSKWLNPSATVR